VSFARRVVARGSGAARAGLGCIAFVLGGKCGSVAGSNENATTDPGEVGAETSGWYSWTPTESGNAAGLRRLDEVVSA
jgi:hypothetical protein